MNSPNPRLSNLEDDGWELEDGEVLRNDYPETFWIPERDIRDNLSVGTIVKLIFRIRINDENAKEEENVERMWVIVKKKVGTYYYGELDDDAYSTDEITAGFKVIFEPRHVIQIYEEK